MVAAELTCRLKINLTAIVAQMGLRMYMDVWLGIGPHRRSLAAVSTHQRVGTYTRRRIVRSRYVKPHCSKDFRGPIGLIFLRAGFRWRR